MRALSKQTHRRGWLFTSVLSRLRPLLILTLAVVVIGLTACQTAPPDGSSTTPDIWSQATANRFRVGEVRDYNGINLDPAIGPRDNSISGVQIVEIESYRLSIEGLVEQSIMLTYDEVIALEPAERLITLYCVEGWDATILWKGVLIDDLIEQAGGATAEANTVIFHAADSYTTSLPLSVVKSKGLIIAYQSNGLPLPPEMGYPLIVVAEDKLGYKWARWVTQIELSDDENYRGFWEQRGYDNQADVRGD